MKNAKIILSKITHSQRLKSFCTNAALILTTLMLLIAAATTAATAQTYTDLFNFNGTDGANPSNPGILAQGRDGNLYGATQRGGTYDEGVVFKVTPSGNLTVLYSFDYDINGARPYGGLTLGTDGNFYGTAVVGGVHNQGTIFKITKSGSLTTLYSFTGGADGGGPVPPPIQGTDGNFYGTTIAGTAYKITPSGTFALLASLSEGTNAPLLQGTDGNFYGTTFYGEPKHCGQIQGRNCGTVFKMTPKGVVKIVHTFDGRRGSYPVAAVIQGRDGNFYGTTRLGGRYYNGVVFKLTPQGGFTVLHRFPDPNYPNDGSRPLAGLVQATDGNFYGVTNLGGTGDCVNTGCGVIFRITPAGAYSILYNFDSAHGGYAQSVPMQHTNGKIYGTTAAEGTYNQGVVYSFDLGLAPFVSFVSTTGKIGQTVEILGQGFTGTTAVSFNGTAATFTVVSDTYLKTTVPAGATTGFVTVTTPSGTLTSNKQFRVRP